MERKEGANKNLANTCHLICLEFPRGKHPLETAEKLPRVIVQTPEIALRKQKNELPRAKLQNSSPLEPRKKKINQTITTTRT